MTAAQPYDDSANAEEFDRLRRACESHGPAEMFAALADSLASRRRWHALFDARMMQARAELGLPLSGGLSDVPPGIRNRLDEKSLAACREVGWPLLDEGHVAAAWMYLRAAAEPADVAGRLGALAASLPADPDEADEQTQVRRQEILGVALWDGVDPALGIAMVIRGQGTCNSITAYEQAVSRLPAARQAPAARVLVSHLHREVAANLAQDLAQRGIAPPLAVESIPTLLAAAGGLADDPSVHVDVSHLQSVLRIARVCTDEPTLRRAWELAVYACRLPADVVYPGEPPFEDVGRASRLFFAAQLGHDVDEAVRFFRAAAATAAPEAGGLPVDALVFLLWRLDRPAEALHAALARPAADTGMPSTMQAAGMLPSLVDLAAASGEWQLLRDACRSRGDEITFAATLVAERQRPSGPQSLHPPHGGGA
jgi:hypothetical protein